MGFNVEDLPWHEQLWGWQPFKIDALGLVTLLGSEEINNSLGRLVPSRYLEYLPLLGAFVIAGERFKEKKPSFKLYNLSDGIHTTDLSFWLPRWMLEQDFQTSRSVVEFEIASEPRSWAKWHIVSGLISFAFTGYLMAMTILIGDWYGFANAIAMVLSIIARAYSMQVHRNAIDHYVNSSIDGKNPTPISMKKCLFIMSDSKAVTVYLPQKLLLPVFIHNPEPANPWLYQLLRYLGWVVFGVHIVTIGMATLVPQVYTVALLVIPTVLICWKLGCDDSKWGEKFDQWILRRDNPKREYECWIGTMLKAYVSEWPVDAEFYQKDGKWTRQSPTARLNPNARSKKRQDLYAWLNLTDDEEASMSKWDLFPHERGGNEEWWQTYKAKKALIQGGAPLSSRMKAGAVIGMQTLPSPTTTRAGTADGSSSSGASGAATPNVTTTASAQGVTTHLSAAGFVEPKKPMPTASLRDPTRLSPGVDDSRDGRRRHRSRDVSPV